MKCIDCKYCLQDQYGSSNWTVEGVTCYCLQNKNPDFPNDRFYEKEPALDFAEKCDYFKEGEGITLDVDRECQAMEQKLSDAYTADDELKKLLDKPVTLNPLESTRYVIPERDKTGGSGANFIVVWKSDKLVNPPIVESIMIGTKSSQGVSFTSRGRAIINSN